MASIRDLTCIRSVSHMAEYGKYEEEFIVYGCACLENGKIVYRISPQYHEVTQFVHQAAMDYRALSPIHSLMRREVVQTGQRDQLLYKTELELASNLRAMFTHHYFDEIQQCMKAKENDEARELLNQVRVQLNGIFLADYLQLYEGLVNMAYTAKNLSSASLTEIQQWLHKVKIQMEHDIVAKKPFVRTFYGIGYIDAKGKYQYKVNAQEDIVLEEQRKIKRQNLCVSPIFSKTYWYDYGIEPKTVREQFKKELQGYYGDVYWEHWRALKALTPAISKVQYEQALARIEAQDTKEAQDAFLEYGYDWNVRSCNVDK